MNATAGGEMRTQLKGPAYGEMDHITWVTMTPNGPDVMNLLLGGMLPGDFLNQKTTLNEKFTDALDYPVGKETAKRSSNQKIAIADGVTIRGRRNSGSDAVGLLTIPEGVTNVFLHGIVTAAIAVDGSGCKHALAVCGSGNVTVSDLTVVSDGDEWLKASDKAKSLRIDNIIRQKPADWPSRK